MFFWKVLSIVFIALFESSTFALSVVVHVENIRKYRVKQIDMIEYEYCKVTFILESIRPANIWLIINVRII